jgi:hypothetical protein
MALPSASFPGTGVSRPARKLLDRGKRRHPGGAAIFLLASAARLREKQARQSPVRETFMKRMGLVVAAAVLLSACSSGNGINPEEDQKEAIQQQKNCADPKWKEDHLGVWYSVCRPNAALR